jgi:hypothetical protein
VGGTLGLGESFEAGLELRQILVDNLPDELDVQAKVLMHDAIAQTSDLPPGDLRVSGQEAFG